MGFLQSITEKTKQLAEAEFEYTSTSEFNSLDALDDNCTGSVMEATVIYLQINNIDFMLKTGKRLAARGYKIYYHALNEICKATGGHLNCYSPNSFLMIYPTEKFDENAVVDIAIKTANLLNVNLREIIEQHTHIEGTL